MMFSIYITAEALADACLQELSKSYSEQSEWFRILRKQEKIYTLGYTPPTADVLSEDDFSYSGIIAGMCTAYNIQFEPADKYMISIKNDHSCVYEKPNAAFFLDISEAEAQKIQEEYGVICQSTEHIDSSIFTEECERYDFVKNLPVKGGWGELFEVQAKVPSNALCIIDRFLFAYDGQNNPHKSFSEEVIYNGLDTITLVLLNALPKIFGGTYHVTIVCDSKKIQNRQTLQQEVMNRISLISAKKGYPILANLIAINADKAPYTNSLTHNRQIISNYHNMVFENGINAIRFYHGSECTAEYTQPVQGQLLYGTGLKWQNSECPVRSIDVTRMKFNEILKRWLKTYEQEHYYYADNLGNSSIRNFKNRLFL